MADQEPHLANSGPAEEASPQQPAATAPPPAEGVSDQASVTPEADVLFPVAAPAESAGASAAAEEPQLPDRIRVHALAKMLGVTSKRILAQLSELGSGARSAQSSLDRAVAETVRDSLAAPAVVASDPSPETSAPSSYFGPVNEPAADAAVPPAAPAFAAPAASHLFASPVQDAAHVMEPVSFMAVADAPLFLPPAPVAGATDKAEPGEDAGTDADTDNDTDDQSARRRRRGRRGRGRGRGETGAENTDDDAVAAPAATGETVAADGTADQHEADTAGESEDEENDGEGATRRRRRRRRRKVSGEASESGGEASEDDPPNTVVHEREPRTKSRARDEVQGIAGSTRLEAKRQRRRDGRDAGRRRPPILTESEFLARRESVDRVMVVREKSFAGVDGAPQAPITQVAVLEDNVLVEHFVTSTTSASMVGNIYLGRVQNVLPSMEAAFVDIGRGRNGVLYAGEVNWEAAGLGGKERKIEQALKPGDQVLVQVSKDPVGHKGARLTTQISLAGRFLVYVPDGSSTGISRKLPDTERKRLKEILREIVPADAGVIIRTASEGVSEAELTRDVERLQATWAKIQDADKNSGSAPQTLYEEPDLLVKVVRDLFNEDFSKLVVEGDRAWDTVEGYVKMVAPDMLSRVERHQHESLDVFTVYRIDEQLAKALDRKVWLPSGGTLVIDRTEAMTVVDVNTGKFTGSGGNLEETVTRNNLEAAEEIVRQMRLRDIGGMIVVDFIDMVLESNRDLVLRRLTEALGRDRTRHQVSEVTSLGLVQMTRKKLGTGLVEAFSTTCSHCAGRGLIVHEYPVESPPEEEQAPKSGREQRKRRGKDKADRNGSAPVEPEEHQAEDASAKRAHPVALAMAAHHEEEHDAEASVPDLGALNLAGPEGDPAVDPGPDAGGDVAQQTLVAAAEPKRRARRRVARAVSAPANERVGEVIVVPVSEAPAAPIVVPAAPIAVPQRRPRRRAVGRPAGPPAEES